MARVVQSLRHHRHLDPRPPILQLELLHLLPKSTVSLSFSRPFFFNRDGLFFIFKSGCNRDLATNFRWRDGLRQLTLASVESSVAWSSLVDMRATCVSLDVPAPNDPPTSIDLALVVRSPTQP